MDYMTVLETAVKWGVSERWVHKYLKDGRVKGAVRFGAVWMIPVAAGKPADPRYARQREQSPLSEAALCLAIEAVHEPWHYNAPDRVPDVMGDGKLRLAPEAMLAYLRGDFEHVKLCYQDSGGDDTVKLLVGAISIPAAISVGDYPFFLEVEGWLKEIAAAGYGPGVTAYARYALASGYIGAHVPDIIADWIKDGDFTELHPLARHEAINRRIDYLMFMKKYESMLDTAGTAMSLLGMSGAGPGKDRYSLTEVNLRVRCAIACHCLGRVDEAKRRLMGAMDAALPHGFITPFSEMTMWLGDLVEQCLNQKYPEWRDAVIGQADRTLANWIAFHNRFAKDNITLILTLREMGIAALAARRVPYKIIARQYHISLGRLKAIIGEIYGKLYVHNRDELSGFVL